MGYVYRWVEMWFGLKVLGPDWLLAAVMAGR
jgi:hypothetical protein